MNRFIIILGDILLLLVFAYIGQRSHQTFTTLGGIVGTAAPFIVTWVLLGFAARIYNLDTYKSVGSMLKRTLPVWAVSIPLAIWLRSILIGHEFKVSFMIVSYVFTLLLVVGWRFFIVWAVKRRV